MATNDGGYGTYSGSSGSGGSGGSSGSGSGSGGSSSKGSGGSGGGGGGSNPYAAAQAAANRKERQAKNKAARRYRQQSQVLQNQVAALKKAVNTGFLKALNQRLANADLVYRQQDQVLMDSYKERVGSLKGAAADNEKARGAASFAALSNRGRERANALSEVAAQGGGESDQLRSQMMSLRNWNANANENNRTFFDTLRSVNSSLTDLNADTKTSRVNLLTQLNADKDQLWTQYYNQRSEGFTQLGNIYGQQSDLLAQAQEMQSTKQTRRQRRRKNALSADAFMDATDAASSAWKNPGIPSSLMNWQGEGEIKGYNGASVLANAGGPDASIAKPEGATLRSWA